MASPTQTQRNRRTQSIDRKALAGRGREAPSKLRYARSNLNLDVNIGTPRNWGEFVENVQKALNNILQYLEEFEGRTERYKDEDGRIIHGGLAHGSVDGGNLAPAVVDELQTMGSTLTDEQWKYLHRT